MVPTLGMLPPALQFRLVDARLSLHSFHSSVDAAFRFHPLHWLLHLYATYSAIEDAEWQTWWKFGLGTLLLSKAMGMAHESIWAAFWDLVVTDGAETRNDERQKEMHSAQLPFFGKALDKDGHPLGAQSMLVPGTQLKVDVHDGRGYRPFVIPGEPIFDTEEGDQGVLHKRGARCAKLGRHQTLGPQSTDSAQQGEG